MSWHRWPIQIPAVNIVPVFLGSVLCIDRVSFPFGTLYIVFHRLDVESIIPGTMIRKTKKKIGRYKKKQIYSSVFSLKGIIRWYICLLIVSYAFYCIRSILGERLQSKLFVFCENSSKPRITCCFV